MPLKISPLYKPFAAEWVKKPGQTVYVGATETAKLIRAQLKARFPRTTFSVVTDKYSGGASVRVKWTDGPTQALVEAVVKPFAGAGFDGMQDLQYGRGAWLLPDGSAQLREIDAHWGTEGERIEAQADGSIPVHFCANYVFADRSISREAMERALASYALRYRGDDLAEAIRAGEVRVQDSRFGGYEVEGAARFRGIGSGSQYGGDCVLRHYAARRMVAA